MKIYVGNLSYETKEDDIKSAFKKYGRVESVVIIRDKDYSRSKGFGFVEMNDVSEGQTAIESLNDTDINGRKIKVNEARPLNSNSGGRRKSGENNWDREKGGFRGGKGNFGNKGGYGGGRGGFDVRKGGGRRGDRGR